VWLEGLDPLKSPIISSGTEPVTFTEQNYPVDDCNGGLKCVSRDTVARFVERTDCSDKFLASEAKIL
jgi:hypothetical protein